jgi:aryl-alcohol dehydrogenase-like predicted oxidoreductase
MSVLQTGRMLYRNFGRSGLKVSVISIGNMINYRPENYEEDKKIVEVSLKSGINFFDTSEIYAGGEAELQLGNILKDLKVPREEIVIATKIHTAKDPDMNSSANTNRKHIRESIKKSLNRLQLDYVDVLYAHMHDYDTPLEEICRGFHEVIEEGQAFYWATSNW